MSCIYAIPIHHRLHSTSVKPSDDQTVYVPTYKSDNLQYNTLGRWDDRLIDQASDLSSIIFFHNFLQNSLQKSFQSNPLFHFQSIKITLGPSDAWLMRRLTQQPSVLY